jgi:2-polyprenyl-3-methyl-5-hydroxy-6-metoxy-1,4-benzoquinol methylase
MSYRDSFIDFFCRVADVSGKTVLEIGSDAGLEAISLLKGRGAKHLIASNMEAHFRDMPSVEDIEVIHMDARDATSLIKQGSIDLIFGIALLEHVNHLDEFLRQMHAIVRPGGKVVLAGSPIWSCDTGHHIWLEDGETRYVFNNPEFCPVPRWAHLYLDPAAMTRVLREKGVSEGHIDKLIYDIYYGSNLNRVGMSQMKQSLRASPFTTAVIETSYPSIPPRDVMAKLRAANWSEEDVQDSQIRVVLEKQS